MHCMRTSCDQERAYLLAMQMFNYSDAMHMGAVVRPPFKETAVITLLLYRYGSTTVYTVTEHGRWITWLQYTIPASIYILYRLVLYIYIPLHIYFNDTHM